MPWRDATGGCHCGSIRIEAELAQPPDMYRPRACDCDFCRKHGAAYVSDAQGSLLIRLRDERRAMRYRQGDELAEFLLCGRCGVLVAALYASSAGLRAALNARIVDAATSFGAEQAVSPRQLAGSEKQQRWESLWFANVAITAVRNTSR